MNSRPRVAVIGAGMAGATCARKLSDAGAAVHLFEKSRGVGGRMATRRVRWTDENDREHEAQFDHGAPAFSVHSAAFSNFVCPRIQRGELIRWAPKVSEDSFRPLDAFESWTPNVEMPSLCRGMVDQLPVTLGQAVDAINRDRDGWRVESLGESPARGFDCVVLAMPPTQAAGLLAPHRRDWAQRARQQRMLPCWTLLGVAERFLEPLAWEVAWPQSGPLAWIIRNECKPGRAPGPGRVHWVAHANAVWSETHLEAPAEAVHATLLSAVGAFLGNVPHWRASQVHRWRYASVVRPSANALQQFWFDAELGLGVCGDYLGGAGVEGAWISGDALATRIAQACSLVSGASVDEQSAVVGCSSKASSSECPSPNQRSTS